MHHWVQVPSLCSCNVNSSKCLPLKPNVEFHEMLSEEELIDLIASSRIAINPDLETVSFHSNLPCFSPRNSSGLF